MKHFEILTDEQSISALQQLIGNPVSEIYTNQNMDNHPLLHYPFDEMIEPNDNFWMSDKLSCNRWLFPLQEKYLYIATDWGDLADLYWLDYYTRECKVLLPSEINNSTLFIQLEPNYTLDKIEKIEIFAFHKSEDIGNLLCDCAIRLTAQNGKSLIISNDSNILGSSRIIMSDIIQKGFIAEFNAFPRVLITQNEIKFCDI